MPSVWQEQKEEIKILPWGGNATSGTQSFKKSKLASPNCSNQLCRNPINVAL